MDTSNKLHIDYRDNPDLAAVLSTKKPGETVSLEIEVTVVRNDDNGLEASLDAVSLEAPDEDGEPTEVSPEISPDSPVMVVLKGKGAKADARPDRKD